MITIYYPSGSARISRWKDRLDQLFFKYELIEQNRGTVPRLVDGEKTAEGVAAVEVYLDNLEQFVQGWYEDRCDRHEFDPDAPLKIQG